jgi:hypothetical protein
MTKKFEDRKYKVIEKIIKIEDERLLFALEEQLKQTDTESDDLWNRVMKPMKKSVTIEDMIKEQNHKPIKADAFFAQAEELHIEESLEELLAELN